MSFFFIILTILGITNSSIQQKCDFLCLSDNDSDKNCVSKNNITVNVSTINETNGVVDFQFNFACNISNYEIRILYNETNCDNLTQFLTYKFKKISKSNQANVDDIEKCANAGKVSIQNLQSGCYGIQILSDDDKILLYNNISSWRTSYIRKDVDAKATDTIHSSRFNGTELIFAIHNAILDFYPEFSLDFDCDHCSETLREPIFRLIKDKSDSRKLILDPSDKSSLLNISCELKKNKTVYADCVISPVSVGNYSIGINFVGDICRDYYPGQNKRNMKNIFVVADKNIQQLNEDNSSLVRIIGIVLGVICIILFVVAVCLMTKLMKITKQTVDLKMNDDVVKVSCNNDTKLKLLLLYARNSEDIMTIMSSFRNIFMHQGIQVYDIYDLDNLKDIYENNCDWILGLTNQDDIKILLFLTPGARNSSEYPQMKNSIDHIYPFAIKHLYSRVSRNSEFHEKIIVAHFSNDNNEYADYDSFSPHLRFRVPDDFFELLQYIQSTQHVPLNNKANNEFNKLSENYEKYRENITNKV